MRQNQLIEKVTAGQLRSDIPAFRAGDTVRVHALIVEGTRERVQIFEGVVIKRHGAGISATYTVRKISNGNGLVRVPALLNVVATSKLLTRSMSKKETGICSSLFFLWKFGLFLASDMICPSDVGE